MPARFRIKIARHSTRYPFKLRDNARRNFLGQYRSLAEAFRAIDNTVRREANMPELPPLTRREVRIAEHHAACRCVVEPIVFPHDHDFADPCPPSCPRHADSVPVWASTGGEA